MIGQESEGTRIEPKPKKTRIEPKPKKTRIEPDSEFNSDLESRLLSESSSKFSDYGLGYQRLQEYSNSVGCRNILKWILVAFSEILIFAGFSALAIYLGTFDKSQDEYGWILFFYSVVLAFACK